MATTRKEIQRSGPETHRTNYYSSRKTVMFPIPNVSMMIRHVLRLERDDKRSGHREEQLQIQNGIPETLFV